LNYHYVQDEKLSIPNERRKSKIFSPAYIVIRQFISESVLYLSRRKLNLFLWLSVDPKNRSERSGEERSACPVECSVFCSL